MRFLPCAVAALFLGSALVDAQTPCQVTSISIHGNVCKCTAEKCDSIQPLGVVDESTIVTYETERGQHHYLTRLSDQKWTDKAGSWGQVLQVNAKTTYQKMMGFGGAFTDAAAITWGNMTQDIQNLLMDQYFGPLGLQYNMGRIPMTGSDFSTHSYSYDDVPGDFNLTHFDVTLDETLKFPLITQALKRNPDIKLFGSTWSPPFWLKDNNNAVGGALKGYPGVNDIYHNTWAQYYMKTIDAYKRHGINLWAVTNANEAVFGGGQIKHWDSERMNVTTLRDWIKYNLGPALKKSHPDVKLIAWDDKNKDFDQVKIILADPDANKYIDGLGIHWYDSWEGLFSYFNKMTDVHNAYPDKWILPTEACEGHLPWSQGVWAGDWQRGMAYAHDILNDILNWGVGWVDWNLMLDLSGGPNHAGNVVDAPIILDTTAKDVFYKQPMYYALGHFSKFIPEGSVRVDITTVSGKPWYIITAFPVESVAFLTPDNNIVVILLNRDYLIPQQTTLKDKRGYFVVTTPPATIQTIIYKNIPNQATALAADFADPTLTQDAPSSTASSSSTLSVGMVVMISSLTSLGVLIIGMLVLGGVYMRMKRSSHVQVMGRMQSAPEIEMQPQV